VGAEGRGGSRAKKAGSRVAQSRHQRQLTAHSTQQAAGRAEKTAAG
jgi:hypothetical protein